VLDVLFVSVPLIGLYFQAVVGHCTTETVSNEVLRVVIEFRAVERWVQAVH
jgi:hypothetical protein